MRFILKLAGKNIEIFSLYDFAADYCKDFISSGTPDISVEITQEDIEFERERSRREDLKQGVQIRNFTDPYLETLAVYRKIADRMLDFDTLLFHGSAVAVDNRCYLFTARSGTGKSTHTRLWKKLLGDRAVIVNDDKPLISVLKNDIIVHGTPWNGKHRLGNDISVPLKAVCVLQRAEENRIKKVAPEEVYDTLIQQVYRPYDSKRLAKTLSLTDALAERTELYRLGCNMDISAAQLSYSAMKGQKKGQENEA